MTNFGAVQMGEMISREDEIQLAEMGISASDVEIQMANFRKGFKHAELIEPAVIGNGILSITGKREEAYIERFDHFRDSLDLVKFVPASGAATRMFKDLYSALEELKAGKGLPEKGKLFIDRIKEFPFYETLENSISENHEELNKLITDQDYGAVIECLLTSKGLDYGNKPKAIIEFHKEEARSILPIEEHVKEGVEYCSSEQKMRLHFTVSPEHLEDIKRATNEALKKCAVCDISVTYSFQTRSTGTIAVYENNEPVRLDDHSLMLRPGGHGALINNLNDISAQMIFIKNIDNVCKSELQPLHTRYKKVLAGRLLEVREELHSLINGLSSNSGRKEAVRFIKYRWGIEVEAEEDIRRYLDRPIRVCGMVKNTGAPGGGPFWIKKANGSKSLQIVESSQIDMSIPQQKAIFEQSTHFNPVDLVCWVRNSEGEKFDLLKYRDNDTGFITEKSFNGKTIKAQELPGLWNGAMADWITEFVEVPLETFNPVKTVFDLLNEGHR